MRRGRRNDPQATTVVPLSPEDVIFLWDAGICVEDPEHFLVEEQYVMELDGRFSEAMA